MTTTTEFVIDRNSLLQKNYNDCEMGMRRARQLFSTLNRYARSDKLFGRNIAAQTIIHETTHLYYGIGQSQWAEAVCFAKEKMFLTGKPLTFAEKRYIVSLAKN